MALKVTLVPSARGFRRGGAVGRRRRIGTKPRVCCGDGAARTLGPQPTSARALLNAFPHTSVPHVQAHGRWRTVEEGLEGATKWYPKLRDAYLKPSPYPKLNLCKTLEHSVSLKSINFVLYIAGTSVCTISTSSTPV